MKNTKHFNELYFRILTSRINSLLSTSLQNSSKEHYRNTQWHAPLSRSFKNHHNYRE